MTSPASTTIELSEGSAAVVARRARDGLRRSRRLRRQRRRRRPPQRRCSRTRPSPTRRWPTATRSSGPTSASPATRRSLFLAVPFGRRRHRRRVGPSTARTRATTQIDDRDGRPRRHRRRRRRRRRCSTPSSTPTSPRSRCARPSSRARASSSRSDEDARSRLRSPRARRRAASWMRECSTRKRSTSGSRSVASVGGVGLDVGVERRRRARQLGVPVDGRRRHLEAHARRLEQRPLEVLDDGDDDVGRRPHARRRQQVQGLQLAHREGGDHLRIAELARPPSRRQQVDADLVGHGEPAAQRVEQLVAHAVEGEELVGLVDDPRPVRRMLGLIATRRPARGPTTRRTVVPSPSRRNSASSARARMSGTPRPRSWWSRSGVSTGGCGTRSSGSNPPASSWTSTSTLPGRHRAAAP